MNTNRTLEFDRILEQLAGHARSERAQEKLRALQPFLRESICHAKMRETTDAVRILEFAGTPPVAAMTELDKMMDLSQKGSMLMPEQLSQLCMFISSCRRMKGYLKKAEALEGDIASYGGSLDDMDMLFEEIERCIRSDRVDDGASPTLRDLRRKIDNAHAAVKAKLESILRGKKEWFADGYVTTRSGRFVLPVKKEYKNQVAGTVVDTSGTGSTYFIEPTAVRKLQEDCAHLQVDEDNEVRKILYTLTALVDAQIDGLKINRDCMETLDFIFAKAKLSVQMKAIPVPVSVQRHIRIQQGRHPLLDPERCIPLDLEIGGDVRGVVITGPNTGGKTVALKTVGLLSLMAQCGLHVPVAQGSTFSMHSTILCDIGDGQSITENLSTFSAHITNIIAILQNISPESLVLLDELGSGTDPAEGMGLAVSILEELRRRGCLFVATTHYPEIKAYARDSEGVINARMAFDRETLEPLYRLQMGQAGESCALYIAQRLGFPAHMLECARAKAYTGNVSEPAPVRPIPEMAYPAAEMPSGVAPVRKIQREAPVKEPPAFKNKFTVGDSVMVYPQKEIGILFQTADEKGMLGVQIKGEKQMFGHKRVRVLAPASELYPPDYDFSIVFDSVENRKAKHKMDKGHCPGVHAHYEEGNR